jgi:hypothetical protein
MIIALNPAQVESVLLLEIAIVITIFFLFDTNLLLNPFPDDFFLQHDNFFFILRLKYTHKSEIIHVF